MAESTGRVCTCEACREHPQSAEAGEHRKLNRVVSGFDEISRVRHKLAPNSLDVRTLRFTIVDDEAARIELATPDRVPTAGWASMACTGVYRTSPDPASGALTAARGRWRDGGAIAIDWLIFAIVGHLELRIAQAGDGIDVTLREPTRSGPVTLHGSS